MHTDVPSEDKSRELRGKRVRSWVYWVSAAVSTLLFLEFAATMLMVPGIRPSTKIWMLSVVGVALAISLGVGTWRFTSTEAPVTIWPLGPMVCVVLLLELAECVINIFVLATKAHP
jgi:hypothetical protein